MIELGKTVWYVVVGKKAKERVEYYPLQIYEDKVLAEEVAKANNELVVLVEPKSLPWDPRCINL